MTLNINKLILLVTLTTIIIGFSACGGGDSDASFKNSETLIPIDINCTVTPTVLDISTYIELKSGDVIVEDENATIETYHDTNGTKKVCIDSGIAHIIRK